MEINLNKPKEVILDEFAEIILKQVPKISKAKALEIARKSMPYLNCPMSNNDRVSPMECMFCPYGHMTECHYPLDCYEAKCSHYLEELGDD